MKSGSDSSCTLEWNHTIRKCLLALHPGGMPPDGWPG